MGKASKNHCKAIARTNPAIDLNLSVASPAQLFRMSADEHEPTIEPNEQFARDLASLDRPPFAMPAAIDDAILRDARAHFARNRSRRMILRIGALVTAAAAVIVIVVHLSRPPARSSQPVAMQPQTSSQVDIVDALKLAKRIRAGAADASRDDINHDGAVNQRDVDAIAMAAVKLTEARVQ